MAENLVSFFFFFKAILWYIAMFLPQSDRATRYPFRCELQHGVIPPNHNRFLTDWLLLAVAVSHPGDEANSTFREIHASIWRWRGPPEIQEVTEEKAHLKESREQKHSLLNLYLLTTLSMKASLHHPMLDLHVPGQVPLQRELARAVEALEGLAVRVQVHVAHQVVHPIEFLPTQLLETETRTQRSYQGSGDLSSCGGGRRGTSSVEGMKAGRGQVLPGLGSGACGMDCETQVSRIAKLKAQMAKLLN